MGAAHAMRPTCTAHGERFGRIDLKHGPRTMLPHDGMGLWWPRKLCQELELHVYPETAPPSRAPTAARPPWRALDINYRPGGVFYWTNCEIRCPWTCQVFGECMLNNFQKRTIQYKFSITGLLNSQFALVSVPGTIRIGAFRHWTAANVPNKPFCPLDKKASVKLKQCENRYMAIVIMRTAFMHVTEWCVPCRTHSKLIWVISGPMCSFTPCILLSAVHPNLLCFHNTMYVAWKPIPESSALSQS